MPKLDADGAADHLPERAGTGTRATVAALGALAIHTALAGALGCSPSEKKDADAPPIPEASAIPDTDAVTFWMGIWKDVHHEDPMYRRLPAGVDTRGWGPMHEGFLDSLASQEGLNRPAEDNYDRSYAFTWDAFTLNIPLWRVLLTPFAGSPNLRYLEVGVAEGRSLLWVLDNVLTHPSSRATVIDPFMVPDHEQRLRDNLKKSSGPEKVRLIKGFSGDVLPTLEPDSYDLIYIDGSHLADDVLLDAVYSWRLLRKGGLIIHDDYMQKVDQPPETHPVVAIDAFVTAMRNTVEVLHRGHQLVLRKLPIELPDLCWNRNPCVRVGRYLYAWESGRLLEVGTRKEIALSESEQAVLQEILRSRRIGAEAELVLEADIAALRARSPREFGRLAELLDLRIASPAATDGAPASDR